MNGDDQIGPFMSRLSNGCNRLGPGLLKPMDSQLTSAQILQETFNAQTSFPHIQITIGNLDLKWINIQLQEC